MVEAKIGLEIHAYLNLDNKTKLFCNCPLAHEAVPNSNTCPVCTGQPGSKPMLVNEEAVRKTTAAALLFKCKLNDRQVFQRKHYSWPDMPTGYQKTMSGSYAFPVGMNGEFLDIGIDEVHLEEDPARWDPVTGCVDYNRSGFPLIEIVTKPEFHSPTQAREWLRNLVDALGYIKAVDPEAGIKADVNVSVGPSFDRVEVKNVNSRKSILKTIEFEIQRQVDEINAGNSIKLQTRTWSEATQETIFMRSKEVAAEYMFIPDPDLPATKLSKAYIKKIQDELPERPDEKAAKFIDIKVDTDDAHVIAAHKPLAELFEKVSDKVDPIFAARWIRREVVRVANYNKLDIEDIDINAKSMIELIQLMLDKKITERTGQKIMNKLVLEDFSPKQYVKKEGLASTDSGAIEKFCKAVIKENAKVAKEFKAGNEKSLNFLIGQVMRMAKGQASPAEVTEIIKKLIK